MLAVTVIQTLYSLSRDFGQLTVQQTSDIFNIMLLPLVSGLIRTGNPVLLPLVNRP